MLKLGVNGRAMGSHFGGWRHPDSWTPVTMSLKNIIDSAQIAERGKLDLIFFADGNGIRSMDDPALFAACSPFDRPAVFEPVTLLTALAMSTRHIGLVATATTTYEEPYTLARKFASLDHISNGRAGWNLVTTSNPEDALNFNRSEHVAKELRYERAHEFADVVRGLWDSWEADAFVENRETGQFLDPAKVHMLNHKGKHFTVRGPLNVARMPQGHPVIFQAGQSEDGRNLAAATADCVFTGSTKSANIAFAIDIRNRMANYGRAPDAIKFLPDAGVYVGRTAEEADELWGELQALISPAIGLAFLSKRLGMDLTSYPVDGPVPPLPPEKPGAQATSFRETVAKMARDENLTIRQTYSRLMGTAGGLILKGTPKQIADEMEDWYTSKACDGFIIGGGVMPRCLEDFVNLVVPELQRRGLFRQEYEGRTLRENLGLPPPPSPFYERRK